MKYKIAIWFLLIIPIISNGQCWKSIASGPFGSGFIDTNDKLTLCGSFTCKNNNVYFNHREIIGIPMKIVKINSHVLALDVENNLWTWGYNDYGELGINSTTSTCLPTKISGKWNKISAGYYHSVAIKKDGTLWAWGFNVVGQLGIGTMDKKRMIPIKIGHSHSWKEISAGSNFTLAIQKNGTLWSWGSNNFGELGNGTNTTYSFPTQIGNEKNWVQICAGGTFSMAIKKDGSLWGWGSNKFGQLSLRNINDSIAYKNGKGFFVNDFPLEDEFLTPQLIDNNRTWLDVAIGYYHAMALSSNYEIWVSGFNPDYRLGDGTLVDKIKLTKLICR